jgi:glycosyltransferase involved in cell wall biosynthesis
VPEVSVILPVYNVETYLPACLDSLLAQSFADFEVLCVNDGSTDGSPTILADYAANDSRFRIINRENGGLAVARDTALPHVRGNYISFVDSDDYLASDCLEKTVAKAKQTDADIVLFSCVVVNEESKTLDHVPWMLRTEKLPDKEVFNRSDVPDRLFQITQPNVWTKLYSARFILDSPELRFHDFRWGEDYPFTYTTLAMARRVTVLDECLYFYRWKRPGSLSMNNKFNPLRFVDPYQQLYNNLKTTGLLSDLTESYTSLAEDGIRYELAMMRGSDSLGVALDFLQNGGLEQIGLEDTGQFGDFSPEFVQGQLDQSISDMVDVIVPVHNGFERLPGFFERLAQTARRHRLILIDDASDDSRVCPYLQDLANKHPRTVLRQNRTRQGFLACANIGISLASNHIALLSQATVLPANWLERLMQPIAADPHAAATLPFSNAASITSFPNWWVDNRLESDADIDVIDALFAEIRPKYHQVPGGASCCLGLSRRALRSVGGFDLSALGGGRSGSEAASAAVGAGAGADASADEDGISEETCSLGNAGSLDEAVLEQAIIYDWCLRATAAGYHNVLAENLYVYLPFDGPAPKSLSQAGDISEAADQSEAPAASSAACPKQAGDPRTTLISLLTVRYPDINSLIARYEWENPAHAYKTPVLLKLALAGRDRLIAERERELADVYNSSSWRVTGFLRNLSDFLRRRRV